MVMSILFTSDDGWIISHLDYLNKIYDSVSDDNDTINLKFNETIFKVNSQYLRQNQVDSLNAKPQENANLVKRKRKSKNAQLLPEDILEQNDFICDKSMKMLKEAENLKFFMNVVTDNNGESREESRKFYLDRADSNCNYHGSNEKECPIIAEIKTEKYVFPNNSIFYCYDVKEMKNQLTFQEKYDFILLDPPWWNKSIRRKKMKFKESSYKMMYNEELAEIPIKTLLSPNGVVAVWCTNSVSNLNSILNEMFPKWDVTFKAKWFWLKVTQRGEFICNFNDIHGKQPYEQIIFGTASSNQDISIPDKKIIISIPSAVHSHKPPITEIIELYLPEKPKCLEIFARYLLPNWTSWGLEVLKFQHLSLYTSVKNYKNSEDTSDDR